MGRAAEPTSVALSSGVEECWTNVAGARVRYLRAGSGPPLILLHGLMGYSFSWRFVVPALTPYATLYAIDMPGAGFSDRCARLDCSFSASALRLLQFAEKLGISSFDLLGTSHGGAVAMMAAGLGTDRSLPLVRRLILVAPVNPWSLHGRRLARFLSRPLVSLLFCKLAPRVTVLHGAVLRRLYGDPGKIRPGTLEGYATPLRLPGSLEYGLKILSTWNEDLRLLESALRRLVDLPTLMVWGSRDRAVDPASAQTLCRYFRNCRLVKMEGVGHLPYEEAPDEFNAVLVDFLTQSSAVAKE